MKEEKKLNLPQSLLLLVLIIFSVAMMAIGNAMGINPGMVAGAVICGAMFGDKLSPLSDTTNLEYAAGISCREPKWQKYHREVHTLSTDLAQVAKKANPKLLVTYHRIYHMNIQDNRKNLAAEMAWRDEAILDEIREAGYEGYVVNGKDLDVF